MILEDYCSDKVRKLLKKRGFPFPDWEGVFEAPIPQSLALKWLRKQGVEVFIAVGFPFNEELKRGVKTYFWSVCTSDKGRLEYPLDEGVPAESYEDAVDKAILYALENILKDKETPRVNMTIEDVISRIREECDKIYEKYEGNSLVEEEDILEGFEEIINDYYEDKSPY